MSRLYVRAPGVSLVVMCIDVLIACCTDAKAVSTKSSTSVINNFFSSCLSFDYHASKNGSCS